MNHKARETSISITVQIGLRFEQASGETSDLSKGVETQFVWTRECIGFWPSVVELKKERLE